MQKKIVRKLTLSRETVALIECTVLKQAAGAIAPATQGPTESFGSRCFDCPY